MIISNPARESVVGKSKRRGMVTFPNFNFNRISLFIFCSLILIAEPSSSSSPSQSQSLSLNVNPKFDPDIDLFGDAEAVDGGSYVKLTRPSPSSSGLLLRRKPISFDTPTSLSAEFSFSISPDDGDGLVLLLVPGDFSARFPGNDSFGLSPRENYLAIEFDTSKDDKVGDLNANHVGIDVGSLVSVAVANVSAVDLVLNSGVKLNAWLDYEAGSKTLEVRLCKLGESRPFNPILAHSIDLFKIWGDQRVFLGISSSNDVNSIQVTRVFSWKVSLRKVSKAMHSQPADPRVDSDQHVKKPDENSTLQWKNVHPLTLLARVIFVTGCVALAAFLVLFVWAIFFQRTEQSLAKTPEHPSADDVRYERIDVAVDKNADDDEN